MKHIYHNFTIILLFPLQSFTISNSVFPFSKILLNNDEYNLVNHLIEENHFLFSSSNQGLFRNLKIHRGGGVGLQQPQIAACLLLGMMLRGGGGGGLTFESKKKHHENYEQTLRPEQSNFLSLLLKKLQIFNVLSFKPICTAFF